MIIKERLLHLNYWTTLLIISVLDLAATFGVSQVLWNDETYYQNFGGGDFDKYLVSVRGIDLIRYCLGPFYLMLKSILIASVLSVSFQLLNQKILFSSLLVVVLLAELALIGGDFFEIVWFILIQPDYGPEDLKAFSMLSIDQVTQAEEVWLSYPLKMINFFQLAYAFLIGVGVEHLCNSKKMMGVAMIVYGGLLFFWILIKLSFWSLFS